MFALGTFVDADGEFPGLVLEGELVTALRDQPWPTIKALCGDWESAMERLEPLAEQRAGTGVPLSSLSVRPPLIPTQVLQSGANYRQHVIDLIVAEQRARGGISDARARAVGAQIMDERASGGEPYVFFGTPTAMCGAYDDVLLPSEGEQHDWELELGVVIGTPGRDISIERALDHVAGYTIVNDVTTRDLVYRPDLEAIGTDWLRSKNAPTFLPTGPFLVPAAFVADPMDLTITLRLNGEVMQDASTADMIFDVARLVAYVSARVALAAGDLLCTGSPAGNGMHHQRFLRDGDVIEAEITGLGRQRNECVTSVVPA
jgi:2-keto-4-pentenoate hydratase/2-oxohepta-3-ene-1,7-dioic acid hydratase in catechol pathway